ncbi:uncharacterized protein CDAR_280671 [Caerostris darwini]|uniref:Uncharacterized protein n=1 Tax=Caerostris darwini TaxID=1538125 RepID=A0AAV4MDI1_9ARAC|nr:uncharacterized protein CDAR_280671 [Caerostris darwini]
MSSPKLQSEDHQTIITGDSPSLEEETSLSEICGFCNLPKRPEKLLLGADLSSLCKCPSASESNDPNIRLGTVPSSAFRRSPSPRPSLIPPPDRPGGLLGQTSDAGKLEIVSIREKHGEFRKAIPHMPIVVAVILCLMNVLLPGTGNSSTLQMTPVFKLQVNDIRLLEEKFPIRVCVKVFLDVKKVRPT